jgi:hypothetical protein
LSFVIISKFSRKDNTGGKKIKYINIKEKKLKKIKYFKKENNKSFSCLNKPDFKNEKIKYKSIGVVIKIPILKAKNIYILKISIKFVKIKSDCSTVTNFKKGLTRIIITFNIKKYKLIKVKQKLRQE